MIHVIIVTIAAAAGAAVGFLACRAAVMHELVRLRKTVADMKQQSDRNVQYQDDMTAAMIEAQAAARANDYPALMRALKKAANVGKSVT